MIHGSSYKNRLVEAVYNLDELVSVIIANYNKDKYIEEAIKSIIKQDYRNLELIIIDDGSTDRSIKIIKDLALSDSRIKYELCDHQGKIKAYNYGISLAHGNFIKIWASDDILAPNAISTLIQEIKGYDVVCHNTTITDENLNIIKTNFINMKRYDRSLRINDVLNGLSFPSGCYLFRRKIVESAFPIPEKAQYEDWYIFMNLVFHKFKIKYLNQSLSCYRQIKQSAYGGVFNHDKQIFLYRLKRKINMLEIFRSILSSDYENIISDKKRELQLAINGNMFEILNYNTRTKTKLRIFIQRYFYFLWEIYMNLKQ